MILNNWYKIVPWLIGQGTMLIPCFRTQHRDDTLSIFVYHVNITIQYISIPHSTRVLSSDTMAPPHHSTSHYTSTHTMWKRMPSDLWRIPQTTRNAGSDLTRHQQRAALSETKWKTCDIAVSFTTPQEKLGIYFLPILLHLSNTPPPQQ